MKKRVLMILVVSCLVFFSTAPAWAGSGNGNITQLLSMNNGVVFVMVTSSYNLIPCNTQGRFAMDTNTAGGRSMYAQILALYLAGKQIALVGSGSCNIWSDSESVNYAVSYN